MSLYIWYVGIAVFSIVALPFGLMSLQICGLHILPIWLAFHGVLSLVYYANSVYTYITMGVEVEALREEYKSLRENIRGLWNALEDNGNDASRCENVALPSQDTMADDDDHVDSLICSAVYHNIESESVHKPFKTTWDEIITILYLTIFLLSTVIGVIVVSLTKFCQQWIYIYSIVLIVLKCSVFFFKGCKIYSGAHV